MAHIIQVGAGSGGMPVLDLVCRDTRITHVTLIEPDLYKPHNVERHLFSPSEVGNFKAEAAERWLRDRRPDLKIDLLINDLLDPGVADRIDAAVQSCDIGICAADNEVAKFHFDALMRRHSKPWTLGEVLSGGIGGFVHGFVPGGPCYGCVASHLQRTTSVDNSPAPDYSQPGGPKETTIPASRASISVIASLHAFLTLELLGNSSYNPGFTSMLFTLRQVPGMFEDAYRPFRFRIPRSPACLICGTATPQGELDQALDDALARLGTDE